MPFQTETIDLDDHTNYPDITPAAAFNPTTTFGHRVKGEQIAKMKIAWWVASFFGDDAIDAFITDGSSTYYVATAIALRPNRGNCIIHTNNLAISSELDARGDSHGFELHISGGKKDHKLNATVGTDAIRHADECIGGAGQSHLNSFC